jgi:hypothetical protein
MKMAVLLGALTLCAGDGPPPANTLRELDIQLETCISREGDWRASGEVTLTFSLRRDGSLIGRPRISFLRAPPGDNNRKQVLQQTAEALDRCLPARITDALGGALAGQPMSLRMIVGDGDKPISPKSGGGNQECAEITISDCKIVCKTMKNRALFEKNA